MLSLVLTLLLAALGLLVTALASADMVWAWGSLGASLVAAVVVVLAWARKRRLPRAVQSQAGEGLVSSQDEGSGEDAVQSEDRAADEADQRPGAEETTIVIAAFVDDDGQDDDDQPDPAE